MCCECASSAEERYCPFPSDEESIDSDRFYDNRNQEDALIASYALVLERCRRYSKIEFLNAVKQLNSSKKSMLSTLFYNFILQLQFFFNY